MGRIDRLDARPQCAAMPEALKEAMLAEAAMDFEAYCNRADPGDEADSVIVELAAIKLAMLGAEGSTAASEGGISRTWDAIPESLKLRMDRWRRPLFP